MFFSYDPDLEFEVKNVDDDLKSVCLEERHKHVISLLCDPNLDPFDILASLDSLNILLTQKSSILLSKLNRIVFEPQYLHIF